MGIILIVLQYFGSPKDLTGASYSWKITDHSLVKQIKEARAGQSFYSPTFLLFNLGWKMEIIPNNLKNGQSKTSMYLCLKALPPNVKLIQLERTYSIGEDLVYTNDSRLSHNSMWCKSWTNNEGIYARSIIENNNEFTFKIDIELYAVYDQNDNDITHKYLYLQNAPNEKMKMNDSSSIKLDSLVVQMEKMTSAIQKIQSRMKQIELKLVKEQKGNNLDDVFKEIDALKKTVNKLSEKVNPKRQQLRAWMEEKVKLPQYYDVLIENGIEDLSTAKLLTMETLKGIGIEKIGHCMKILHAVALMNEHNL